MNRLLNILFWSVISAAFIGPGTVTTAASAGAQYQYALLWALTFSTIACLVLQEASARLTIVSGNTLGEAIRGQFSGGFTGIAVLVVVTGAILLGCAAYEAGNILGGVAGAALATGLSPAALTLLCGLAAGLLLWFGTTRFVAQFLGAVVAIMGLAFFATAIAIAPALPALLRGGLLPAFPENSGLLIMGLIGTTVVPYNLFLGSGIARGAKLREMRFGLGVAVLLGGAISMAVLIVGSAITGPFSYPALASALRQALGGWADILFAIGLFAAGFSSAITAPLAAAITAGSLFGLHQPEKWHEHAGRYRSVWLVVLLAGVFFGLSGVRPIPAIILAQALNGVLLPFVAVFLFLVINNPALMGKQTNHAVSNSLMVLVLAVSVLLGVRNIVKAASAVFQAGPAGEGTLLLMAGLISAGVFFFIYRAMRRQQTRSAG